MLSSRTGLTCSDPSPPQRYGHQPPQRKHTEMPITCSVQSSRQNAVLRPHGFSHAPFALNAPFAPQSDTPDHYTPALRDALARPTGLSAPHPSHPAERTAPRHTPPIALP